MTCLQCTNWKLKDSPLRKSGYGLCRLEQSRANYFSEFHKCNRFVQAPPETIKAREADLRRK